PGTTSAILVVYAQLIYITKPIHIGIMEYHPRVSQTTQIELWRHQFGRGAIRSCSEFGHVGARPRRNGPITISAHVGPVSATQHIFIAPTRREASTFKAFGPGISGGGRCSQNLHTGGEFIHTRAG